MKGCKTGGLGVWHAHMADGGFLPVAVRTEVKFQPVPVFDRSQSPWRVHTAPRLHAALARPSQATSCSGRMPYASKPESIWFLLSSQGQSSHHASVSKEVLLCLSGLCLFHLQGEMSCVALMY